MLIFRGGTAVMPQSKPTNVDGPLGVSTSALFPDPGQDKLKPPVFLNADLPQVGDIPDLITNPRLAHFFNTDCISCHTGTTRRKSLSLPAGNDRYHYARPRGISGVADEL